ncbi:MAG: 50S ribosomal protein L10 [Dehalococcoidia bacterium]|jgi:large subunit ribosomal protein L10|nr:50S ribosomal protein L10 [Dehalococcoidia bacterium]
MPTEKAIAEVEELKGILSEAKLIISTDYRGLNVTELSALRRAVREAGGTYRVTKNTMVKIASAEIDRPEINDIVVGPTGFVLSVDDPVAPARALMKHIEENRLDVVINGAFLEGQLVGSDRVKYLSTLPGREELVARVLGQMNAPIANLVSVLAGTVRGLLTVLQAHIDQGGSLAVADADDDAQAEVPDVAPEAATEQAEEPVAEATTDEPEVAEEEPVAEAEAEAEEEEPADEPEAAEEESVAEAEAEAEEEEPADEPEAAEEEPVAEAEAEAEEEEEPADEPEAAEEEPVAEAEAETEEEPADEPEAADEEPVTEAEAEVEEAEEDKPAE